jgi:hypothetical protein
VICGGTFSTLSGCRSSLPTALDTRAARGVLDHIAHAQQLAAKHIGPGEILVAPRLGPFLAQADDLVRGRAMGLVAGLRELESEDRVTGGEHPPDSAILAPVSLGNEFQYGGQSLRRIEVIVEAVVNPLTKRFGPFGIARRVRIRLRGRKIVQVLEIALGPAYGVETKGQFGAILGSQAKHPEGKGINPRRD